MTDAEMALKYICQVCNEGGCDKLFDKLKEAGILGDLLHRLQDYFWEVVWIDSIERRREHD